LFAALVAALVAAVVALVVALPTAVFAALVAAVVAAALAAGTDTPAGAGTCANAAAAQNRPTATEIARTEVFITIS
jgi:phosphate/sulfate permease